MFGLVVGCFVMAVGLFVARSTSTGASQALSGPMLLALGARMLVMAALNALSGRMRRVRTILRVLVMLLSLVGVPLPIGVMIVAEFR